MRILHAADIHLDSPLAGLRQRAGARGNELADATRRAFKNLIQYAVDQKVDVLVIAGDNYDGRHRDYGSLLFFAREMKRLDAAGIRVVMLRGNHDAENQMQLRLPEGVILLSAENPETILFDDLKLAIHGQSFARRDVRQNLAAHYPEAVAGCFNLGLLHTAVEGFGGTHQRYAPCTVKDLVSKRYEYWALGHVHARTEVEKEPFIVYPGNLQSRHINEPGEKGATLLTVSGGRIAEIRHVPLDVVRWARVEIDVSSAPSIDDVASLLDESLNRALDQASGRTLAARLVLIGETPLHGALKFQAARLEAEAARAADAAGDIWLEGIELKTLGSAAVPGDEAIAALIAEAGLIKSGHHEEFMQAVEALPKKLAAALRRDAGIDAIDPAMIDRLIDDARDLLVARLQA